MKKLLISTCVIFLAIFAFFFSNIKGYYRFKQYCEAEGGLRVYEPLERNVGWLAKDESWARFTSSLENVQFIRFKDGGAYYDLYPIGDRYVMNPKYEIKTANLTREPKYILERIVSSSAQSADPSSITYQIKHVSENKILAEFKVFYYEFFDSNVTPMGVTQRYSCFDDPVSTYAEQWILALNNTFK